MEDFALVSDLTEQWRELKKGEPERAEVVLRVVSNSLRVEAQKIAKYLDQMVEPYPVYADVVKSVTVDVVATTSMPSTHSEPMTQVSEAALGYSWQCSFLTPGGGLFIKNS